MRNYFYTFWRRARYIRRQCLASRRKDINLILHRYLRAVCRREPSVDFQTAQAAGLSGVADPEGLARAAEEGRVLVTHDFQTMPQHFAGFIVTQQSAGLLLIRQHLTMASAVDDLLLIWSTMEADEWINVIWYLLL